MTVDWTAQQQRQFCRASLAEKVQMAQAAAIAIVQQGVADLDRVGNTEMETVPTRVARLTGATWPDFGDDADVGWLEDSLAGAYALGIAVGQLVSPTAFTTRADVVSVCKPTSDTKGSRR